MTYTNGDVVPFWCSNSTGNMTIYLTKYYCSVVEINMTSCQPVQTETQMDSIRILCETSEIFWYSVFWFSVVFGLIGNSLAFVTIASLPVSIATFYVGLLAVSDFIAIVVRLTIYFLNRKNLIRPETPYWHIFPLLFDFTVSYSSWLLVLICVDRFISIRYPLKRRFYFTLRHARMASMTIGAVLFSIFFVAVQVLGYMDTKMLTVRNFLYSFIPLIFILILIVLIVIQFRIIRKKRKLLSETGTSSHGPNNQSYSSPNKNISTSRRQSNRSMKSNDSSTTTTITTTPVRGSCTQINSQVSNHNHNITPNPNHHHHTNHNQHSFYHRRTNVFEDIERLENNITLMMLIAAIFFAILTIPNCVLLFTYSHAHIHWNTPLARAGWHVFSKISQVLTFLNLAINFFLYFLSARKFRHQLYHLFRCRRKSSPYNSSHAHHNTEVNTTHDDQSETFL